MILAIYIQSYFGGFGLYTVMPFPEDVIVTAVIILGFYFGAVKSGFRNEGI